MYVVYKGLVVYVQLINYNTYLLPSVGIESNVTMDDVDVVCCVVSFGCVLSTVLLHHIPHNKSHVVGLPLSDRTCVGLGGAAVS